MLNLPVAVIVAPCSEPEAMEERETVRVIVRVSAAVRVTDVVIVIDLVVRGVADSEI